MFKYKVDKDIDLRLLEERHAEQMFARVEPNRLYLRKWLSWIDDTQTSEDTRLYISNALRRFANSNGLDAGIWYKDELVGSIGFHYFNWLSRKTEIGYWLVEEYQGKGIMTKACSAMLDYAFDELLLNRVEIHCATDNDKSRAIPERLGFLQEGTLRQIGWLYDHLVDHVVYGMLNEEWHRLKNQPKF